MGGGTGGNGGRPAGGADCGGRMVPVGVRSTTGGGGVDAGGRMEPVAVRSNAGGPATGGGGRSVPRGVRSTSSISLTGGGGAGGGRSVPRAVRSGSAKGGGVECAACVGSGTGRYPRGGVFSSSSRGAAQPGDGQLPWAPSGGGGGYESWSG